VVDAEPAAVDAAVVDVVVVDGCAAADLAAGAEVAVVATDAGCVVVVCGAAGVGVEAPTTWTTAFIQGCGSQW
jgi:hypothetical protein